MTTATPKALAAVRAVKRIKQWGPLMALRYIIKRQAVTHANAALKFEQRRKSHA